jgi:hypothetical protein
MNAKHTTRIITAEDQIPDGFVPINHFRENGFVQRWATIAKAISDAHSVGRIRAVKLCRTMGDLKTGAVYVHEGDATAFLAARYPSHDVTQEPEVATPAGKEPAVDGEASEAIERLTAALGDLMAAMADLTVALRLKAEATLEEAAS